MRPEELKKQIELYQSSGATSQSFNDMIAGIPEEDKDQKLQGILNACNINIEEKKHLNRIK